jgi:hypothetical protein
MLGKRTALQHRLIPVLTSLTPGDVCEAQDLLSQLE